MPDAAPSATLEERIRAQAIERAARHESRQPLPVITDQAQDSEPVPEPAYAVQLLTPTQGASMIPDPGGGGTERRSSMGPAGRVPVSEIEEVDQDTHADPIGADIAGRPEPRAQEGDGEDDDRSLH
jgi:hypothetical protein